MVDETKRKATAFRVADHGLHLGDVCEVPMVHVEKVRALKDHILPAQIVQGLADLFKVMGGSDPCADRSHDDAGETVRV